MRIEGVYIYIKCFFVPEGVKYNRKQPGVLYQIYVPIKMHDIECNHTYTCMYIFMILFHS